MTDSLDRLQSLKREELNRVFPSVLSELKGLCSGDPVAMINRSFEERSKVWKAAEKKYSEDPYLGNFFADTISLLHAAKEKAHIFEAKHPELVKQYRGLFTDVDDGIVIDLLVAILINRCYKTLTSVYPGFNIRHESDLMIGTLRKANDLQENVAPRHFTLEYVLRAVFTKKIMLSGEEKP